jgi:raffinose/stachyose/melibiose transport system permease protein
VLRSTLGLSPYTLSVFVKLIGEFLKSKTLVRRRHRQLLLFTSPALTFFLLFAVFPLLSTIYISFYQEDVFVGLKNFEFLFTNDEASERLRYAFLHNVQFFLIAASVQLPTALCMAALLTSGRVRRMTSFYRTLLFIPTTLSVVIVGFIWRLIIHPLWGIVDYPLLGEAATALPTITLMSVWQYLGIPMVFLYSALISIPSNIIEAAQVDGASDLRIFFRIKIPLIAPQIGIITILTFIWIFNAFDIIYALNGGAPGPDYATDVLGTLFYRTFFGWGPDLGNQNLGAATATVIFFIILFGTAVYFATVQRRLKASQL